MSEKAKPTSSVALFNRLTGECHLTVRACTSGGGEINSQVAGGTIPGPPHPPELRVLVTKKEIELFYCIKILGGPKFEK